ncbi:matrilin-2-like [Haliotis rubra]|uniref:matrilin-2-like n=1 Tax=Haliotis rubra TaxID=36100 RepID=UPI001EE5BBB2|nr:matrilin-2-like [Haliotis rubra]
MRILEERREDENKEKEEGRVRIMRIKKEAEGEDKEKEGGRVRIKRRKKDEDKEKDESGIKEKEEGGRLKDKEKDEGRVRIKRRKREVEDKEKEEGRVRIKRRKEGGQSGDGARSGKLDNTDPCARNPCANGGRCESKGSTYNCNCLPGFTGRNCTDCTQQPQDILIMEDVSRSVGKESFEEVRRFEQSLLSPFKINVDADSVAYMVFSANARVVFSLSEYSNSKSSVLAALKNEAYESGTETDIVEAINVAVNSVFTLSEGDRPNATNVVIMFTDGFDTETKREVIDDNISRLHAKAEVFVVALSDVKANSTVYSLASKPGNIFQIGSNAGVSSIQTRLKSC